MDGYVFKNQGMGVPFIGVFDTPEQALRYMDDFKGQGDFILLRVSEGAEGKSGDITFKQVGTGTAM